MTHPTADELRGFGIATRFRGPPASGNGGYTAGRLAALAAKPDAIVTVTLRRPPPLETWLSVRRAEDLDVLADGDVVIAEAKPGELRYPPVTRVDEAAARAAHASYAGLNDHSFDTCFVCGPGREEGDGLRLFPGLIAAGRTACVWVPDPSLADPADASIAAHEFVWSALDCPGGWTSDLAARPLVLGRMTATVSRRPTIGEPVVVVGEFFTIDGRKTLTATAAYDADGEIVGRAEQVWIEIDPAAFSPDATAAR